MRPVRKIVKDVEVWLLLGIIVAGTVLVVWQFTHLGPWTR